MLVNIHGQHGSQQLLNRDYHAIYLDRFLTGCDEVLSEYQKSYDQLCKLKNEEKKLLVADEEKSRKIELLTYQIKELEDADLTPGEEETLLERRKILRNRTKLMDSLSEVVSLLSGDDDLPGVTSSLQRIEKTLLRVSDLSPELEQISGKLSSAAEAVMDVSEDVRFFFENYDCSPEEIERVETRCDLISKLKGKYGPTIEDILIYLDHARSELNDITFAEERAAKIGAELAQCLAKTNQLAECLYNLRCQAAADLQDRIAAELAQLDMDKVVFSIAVTKRETLDQRGLDDVEFLISTNPGEPIKPLNKIASGGELSRIMLAIKNVFASNDHIPTLIFDEIDTGISGRAAQRVAEKLWQLSNCKQVVCVTHLAQIAAMADVHYRIEKSISDQRTYTQVLPLDFNGRVDELARITGGINITDMTRSNACELLQNADHLKKELAQ